MKKPLEFDSFGEVSIKGFHWGHEQINPRGILVIAHGMAEYIDRYEALARFMTGKGIFVYGHSHRGHGQTAGSIDALGDLGENGWIKTREDLRQTVLTAHREYPGLPVFLLGHSMGSFLVRDLIETLEVTRYHRSTRGKRFSGIPDEINICGAVLSGTGYPDPWTLRLGKWIASLEMKVRGPLYPSKRLYQMSFGKYNKRIPEPQSFFDWLSRDREQVKKYESDPYCGTVHSCRFYRDFAHHLQRILYRDERGRSQHVHQKPGNRQNWLELSLLLVSGEEDPVGKYGEEVRKTWEVYRKRGYETKLKLYPGARHELLNELNRMEVYSDIFLWLDNKIRQKEADQIQDKS